MCRTFLLTFLTAVTIRSADFSRDIAPILVSECLTCHSAEKAKGGYRVHTYTAVLQPGKSKQPAIIPGEPDDSELFAFLKVGAVVFALVRLRGEVGRLIVGDFDPGAGLRFQIDHGRLTRAA